MPTTFVIITLVWMTGLLAASVWAILRAHTSMARLLALDTAALLLVALMALIAHVGRRPFLLDTALMLALIAFVGTLAAARFYSDGRLF